MLNIRFTLRNINIKLIYIQMFKIKARSVTDTQVISSSEKC